MKVNVEMRSNRNESESEASKHRKNCECCPMSQLIVNKDCHEFRFSIVSIVISVSNVKSPVPSFQLSKMRVKNEGENEDKNEDQK